MKRIVNINGQIKEEVLISKLEIENRDLKRQITELKHTSQLQQTGVMQRNCKSFGCVDPDNSGQCIYCGKILDND